jgi:hypothetical protein
MNLPAYGDRDSGEAPLAYPPLILNRDIVVRGALAVSAIGLTTSIVFLEVVYLLVAANFDNAALKKLGIAHQAYGVYGTIVFSAIFDVVFLPVMIFTTRAYLRSHWKMALFSSLVWAAQIVFTNICAPSLPDPYASLPNDVIATLLIGYLAVRWRQIKAQP